MNVNLSHSVDGNGAMEWCRGNSEASVTLAWWIFLNTTLIETPRQTSRNHARPLTHFFACLENNVNADKAHTTRVSFLWKACSVSVHTLRMTHFLLCPIRDTVKPIIWKNKSSVSNGTPYGNVYETLWIMKLRWNVCRRTEISLTPRKSCVLLQKKQQGDTSIVYQIFTSVVST